MSVNVVERQKKVVEMAHDDSKSKSCYNVPSAVKRFVKKFINNLPIEFKMEV